MDQLRQEFEVQRQAQHAEFEARVKQELDARRQKLDAKRTQMEQQWKEREYEAALPETSGRIVELENESNSAMKEYEAALTARADEQYKEFVARLEESQQETLAQAQREVDAQMGQLNHLDNSMSTAALLQLKQEATNRYSQVQGALMTEKTRQLAVFKAKQDE